MARDKQRSTSPGGLLFLVGVNTAVFAAAVTASVFGVDILDSLVLKADGDVSWRPLTYMFIHTGLLHFLFNMALLTAYGILVCSLGLHRFLVPLYLAGGLAGALVFRLFATEGTMLAGSSAAVLCALTAIAYWAYDLRVKIIGNIHAALGIATAPVAVGAVVLPLCYGETGACGAHIAGIVCGVLLAVSFSMPARAILTRTRRSRAELIEKRRVAVEKASRSGYAALTKSEKDIL